MRMNNDNLIAKINEAFSTHHELRSRIHGAIKKYPDLSPLFADISIILNERAANGLDQGQSQNPPRQQGELEPSQQQGQLQNKKRKHGDDNGILDHSSAKASLAALASAEPYFSAAEISFSIPQRKKLKLEFMRGNRHGGGIRTVQPDGTFGFGVRWSDIDQIFCLPVPEKATKQRNYVVVPHGGNGLITSTTVAPEPIVWTVPETTPKTITLGAGDSADSTPQADKKTTTATAKDKMEKNDQNDGSGGGDEETYVTATSRAIRQGWGREVVVPRKEEFVSALRESHRKGEPAWHVKAFRGSKEGYLFFLPPGILWAFKKPLLYFPLLSISSVSYTSVLQRTFNLNIIVNAPSLSTANVANAANAKLNPNSNSSTNNNNSSTTPNEVESDKEIEFEFSMLDQADYATIDGYIKRHALNDASMAELRRAKLLNINGPPVHSSGSDDGSAAGGTVEGTAGGIARGTNAKAGDDAVMGNSGEDDGSAHMSELEKAQRMLEDEEDEQEEDYVPPGSDDGSEEESGSSEGEGDDGGEGEMEDDDDEVGEEDDG